MNGRQTFREPVDFLGDPPPRDFLALLAVLFVTFSLGFFQSTAIIPALLSLTPLVWLRGFVWQLLTYPFAASTMSPWFLLSLLIIYMFGKEVRRYLGPRGFWRLLLTASLVASVVAVLVQLVMTALGAVPLSAPVLPFSLMQGDRMVLTILIAAFATVYGHAVINLFFVLPIRARVFLWLEILFAFVGFLTTKDFAGFVGICAAVGATYAWLTGGLRRTLREWRLRAERRVIEARLRTMRKKRGIHVVKDDGGDARRGPWLN